MKGIDYSFSHPSAAQITAAGVQFVCRYLAPSSPSTEAKILSAAEAAALHAAELPIVLVWEWTANRAVAGRAAGVSDARAALAQANALGASGVPIFFAVDFDVSAAQCRKGGAVYAYAQGWASVLGVARSGVYGGYTAVSALMGAGLCRYGWQTFAWSGGRWYAGAQIRQTGSGTIGGHSIDWNSTTSDDYGAWEPADMTPAQQAQLTAIENAVTGHGLASWGYVHKDAKGRSLEAAEAVDVHQVLTNIANGVAAQQKAVTALATQVAALAQQVSKLAAK